jgi:hypothetical protein
MTALAGTINCGSTGGTRRTISRTSGYHSRSQNTYIFRIQHFISVRIRIQGAIPMCSGSSILSQCGSGPGSHPIVDPDPVFYLRADPDPGSHPNVDPDLKTGNCYFWSFILLLDPDPHFPKRIWIQQSQNNADPDPQHCFFPVVRFPVLLGSLFIFSEVASSVVYSVPGGWASFRQIRIRRFHLNQKMYLNDTCTFSRKFQYCPKY